jgi:hypothetical protein
MLRRDPLIRVLEDEDEDKNEDKGEDDLWTDAREDAIFVRPAYITEALREEDVPTEAFEDELV